MSAISLPERRNGPFALAARRFLRVSGAWPGVVILGVLIIVALAAPWLYPGDPLRIVAPPQQWPLHDWRYPLGTDSMGRDIAALIAHGARATLSIGLLACLTATVIGVLLGAVAGYFGGAAGAAAMLLTELFQTIPALMFVLAIVSIFGTGVAHTILAIGAVTWPPVARLTRAEFLTWRSRDFIASCRSLGMTDTRIIFSEILPNALPPIIALATIIIAGAILLEAGLSFLGLSDPAVATWGRLIGEGRDMLRTSWYISALPGGAILLTVFALSLVGEAIGAATRPAGRRA
ncbi:ABC transporter permease [Bordetella genomosp. 10]|uniref:ABC transporter permease n=1 Tax=Bordetella genomosp. 10 TaxID=1416804 RepID=A0A261SBA0_9BORD|nr:ABC transporter permease [Bordetella genomosp. 10]OZI34669.1 ABC transporter permease [Bordetella genomosp. 10]